MDKWADIEDFVRRVYPDIGRVNIQPYAYRVAFANLAAGANAVGQLNANANSDFVLVSPRYRCATAADFDITPQVRIQLIDTGSSTQMFDQAVDISTFFGRVGNAPLDMVFPRIIPGRSALQVNVSNYSAAATYTFLELTFAGVLIQSYN